MKRSRRAMIGALAILALAAGGLVPAQAAGGQPVLVFAAASLRNALGDAIAAYERQGGGKVVVSYDASSTLARQIENGADADIFISADLDWMDEVARRHLIDPATRRNLLGNRLVLIAPRASRAAPVTIKPGFDLKALLQGGLLAMADPDSVPAGKYGKAALRKLGVWGQVEGHIARAQNVRGALLFVDRGETPYGIVYATDAAADPAKVKVVGVFPADSHPPIIYPIALVAGSRRPEARKFLAFLESAAAKTYFEKQGFTVLP